MDHSAAKQEKIIKIWNTSDSVLGQNFRGCTIAHPLEPTLFKNGPNFLLPAIGKANLIDWQAAAKFGVQDGYYGQTWVQ